MVFQTQVPISLVILVIGIQDLYMSKYKYTITIIIANLLYLAMYLSMYVATCDPCANISAHYISVLSHNDSMCMLNTTC